MGVNIRGACEKEIPPHLPSREVLFSPAWFLLPWPQPQNNAQKPRPFSSFWPLPTLSPCPHLTPYSPGSLEVLRLCAFAHVIPLPTRPFLLIVFLNNFPWVLPGRVDRSGHRGGQVGRTSPRTRTSAASLLHPLTPGILLLPEAFSPKRLLSP